MSAPPKRSHEEATPPAISKRSVEEDGVLQNNPVKLSQPSIGLSNVSSESGLDLRAAKIQRVEQRDVEKRLSPLPFYRLSSSVNGPSSDHPVTNDGKENRDGKSDSREAETSTRDLIADPRVETPVSKAENDTKQENKGEDKLLRPDRESISDFKSESRLEKEGVGWKESKEYHRTKRHSEAQTEHGSQVAEEVRKDVLIGADRDSSEAQEALAESRIDLKGGDERVKDRERRKKEEKHREWGEREKDRSERRAALKPTGNGSKDFAREDRESDRWERERKDTHRDKERRDKEKDSLLHAKEMVEVPPKIPDQEGTSSESKKTNDYDVSKDVDRDVKDKKRERDPDSEMDRSDKRRHQEKESEDGLTEAANEREREPFGYGVQQRKRMLRPRATHSSNREHRFRARARENDGSQGKLDSSAIAYRVGECMQELMKSWREFEASRDGKTDESSQNGPTLEIRIPAEHVTATNRQVRGGQLWGTDIYTDDSDLVAVLMHTGYCRPTSSLPPPSIQELRATVRVLPPQNCYYSTLRNNVRSRAWGVGIGCSYRVERCTIIKKGGGTLDLEPCLTLISAVEPTLAPVSVERTMTTRSAASNALRQQRFVREVTVQYNLCNEPWVKYSINFVADKGLKKPLYTSARLKKGEVIYLETHFKRYELCYNGEKTVSNGGAGSHATEPEPEKPHHHGCHGQSADKSQERDNFTDVFRWSLCKKPLPQEVMRSIGIPLPVDHLEVLEENLEWDEVQWSQTGVWVAGKEYQLARVHFLFPS